MRKQLRDGFRKFVKYGHMFENLDHPKFPQEHACMRQRKGSRKYSKFHCRYAALHTSLQQRTPGLQTAPSAGISPFLRASGFFVFLFWGLTALTWSWALGMAKQAILGSFLCSPPGRGNFSAVRCRFRVLALRRDWYHWEPRRYDLALGVCC